MNQSRENEFIEAWSGVPRDELPQSEITEALNAYHTLLATEIDLDFDSAAESEIVSTGLDTADHTNHIDQIAAQLTALQLEQSNIEATEDSSSDNQATQVDRPSDNYTQQNDKIVKFPKKRQRSWTTMVSAMAACLALALGLKFLLPTPQQSDDWGQQHVVVRGNDDIETTYHQIDNSKPKKANQQLINSLKTASATYRSEKKASSVYQTVFKLKEPPSSDLTALLDSWGVSDTAVNQWYVLRFTK